MSEDESDSEYPDGWWQEGGLGGIIALSVVLWLIYNFVVLLGFGPDEPRHMNFVKLLLNERRLPLLLASGQEYAGAHTLHPPLYYALLVPFYAATRWMPGESEWHV